VGVLPPPPNSKQFLDNVPRLTIQTAERSFGTKYLKKWWDMIEKPTYEQLEQKIKRLEEDSFNRIQSEKKNCWG